MSSSSSSSSLPGYAGFSIIGDYSMAFYRDPTEFVTKKVQELDSKIFLARFLNKPTVFITSHAGVKELLTEKAGNFEMGYKEYLSNIYGDNVLFFNGTEAEHHRDALHRLLVSSHLKHNLSVIVDRLNAKYLSSLETETAVPVYNLFKRISTEICLSYFLDVDFEASCDIADSIVALTTSHWHGIISMRFNLSIPMIQTKSTYSHAMQAKMQLLDIISKKMDPNVGSGLSALMSVDDQLSHPLNHMLLFTSALVPKAIASLLTSFVLALANNNSYLNKARDQPEMLEWILLEVQRLWPPFIAGRRVAQKKCTVGGYRIKAGVPVMYMSHNAHRDPQVFHKPDEFLPERWKDRTDGCPQLFTFGAGPRQCIGTHIVMKILKSVCGELVSHYSWQLIEDQSVLYKWLPVSRPKSAAQVKFTKLNADI